MLSGQRFSRLAAAVMAGLVTLLVTAVLLAIIGVNPIDGLQEIWTGAFGSKFALGNTTVKTLPLLFTALGFTVAYRCGIFNLGLEGQLYMGALAAVVIGTQLHAPAIIHLPVAIVASALAGALWAAIPAALKLWRGVNEIVTSLFLSYVAILFTSYMLNGPLAAEGAGFPQSEPVATSAQFPILVSNTKISYAIFLALAAAIAITFLFRTRLGYEMRTVGASRRVADYAGINSRRVMATGFLLSGALGGLAGMVEVLGNQYVLIQNFSPGWGYTGIAAAVLGGLTAWGCVAASIFFGVISSGADQLQLTLHVSSTLALVVQALAVIFVLLTLELYRRFELRTLVRSGELRARPGRVEAKAKS
jgi:simple sugar transport system permease protein